MGTVMATNSSDTVHLLERARAGGEAALTQLFTRHRDRRRRTTLALQACGNAPPVE